LSKRVLAAFLVTLFIIATFATVAEVQAHFTLGLQGTSGPTNYGSDVDPAVCDSPYYRIGAAGSHVTGHVAYVTPGLNYKPPVEQFTNYYSPDGAIITDTSGALLFFINISDVTIDEVTKPNPLGTGEVDINWDGNADGGYQSHALYINIPPEFGVPEGWGEGTEAYIATSITNDWRCIWTGQWGASHDFAPNWWYVAISVPTDPDHEERGWLYPKDQDPYTDRQIRSGCFRGCYWVWIGGLTAPSCAGKYFFKIFSTDPAWPYYPWEWYVSFPAANYPTLIVKAELDPGYISGKILYCGSYYYGYYYGKPIERPGRVTAEGEALDPVTNEPTGRKVCAVGYFNASAQGYYEIEGLAPGIYTLTAEAEGFPPVTLATEITVKRGQSIHGVNIYVCPGAKIKLKVNSKCPTGRVEFPHWVSITKDPWQEGDIGKLLGLTGYPMGRYVVDIKDSEGNFMARKKGYWDLKALGGNESFTVQFGDVTSYAGAGVVWDGHVPDEEAHTISGLAAGVYYAYANVFGYVQLEDYEVVVPSAQYTGEIYREMDIFQGGKVHATVHFHNQEMPSADEPPITSGDLVMEAYDSEGTLRAWNYTRVTRNTVASVTVDLIGDAWIPYGMPADTYTFKVWYPGYAQQEFPMHTVQLCTWNSFSFHLIKGGNITVTVYSRDWQSPSQPLNWLYDNAALRVYFYNSADEYVGRAQLNQDIDEDSVTFRFFGMNRTIDHYILYGWYSNGLPTDVYSIKAYTVGYVQKAVPEVWVQKASSTGDIPLYLYAGARITINVNFKIEELIEPLDIGKWSYYFRINVFDEEGNLAAANITSVPQETDPVGGTTTWTFRVAGFGAFSPPGEHGLPAAWPPDFPPEEGFIPTYAWGYYEPFTSALHYDYGIDAGTYTLEVIEESGAYVQIATVAVTVSLMGEATVFLDMHKQAYISGTVYQRNYMGDFRTASWYVVELAGSPEMTTDTRDGFFDFWAPAGTYTMKVHLMAPDHTDAVVMQERTVVVTWGADAGGQNFYLEEGGIPIPEFPAAGVLMLISALAASLYLLRWRKQAIVPMP